MLISARNKERGERVNEARGPNTERDGKEKEGWEEEERGGVGENQKKNIRP